MSETKIDMNLQRVLARFKAAVLFCYPDDITPTAKRFFDSIIDEEVARPIGEVSA